MQLTRLLAIVLTLNSCASLAATQARECDRLYLQGQELWLAHGNETHRIATDPLGIILPRFSPDERRIAYAHAHSSAENQLPSIVICSTTGDTLKVLSLPSLPISAILRWGWKDQGHIWLEGHNSPVTSTYYEVDLETGTANPGLLGTNFAVSPNGDHVVHTGLRPRGSPESATVWLDERRIYPAAKDTSVHVFAGEFVWSPDSATFAILDSVDGRSWGIVLLSAESAAVHKIPLPPDAAPADLRWLDATTLLITSGETHYAIDKTSFALRPADAMLVRRLFYVNVGGKLIGIEDRRCAPPSVTPH